MWHYKKVALRKKYLKKYWVLLFIATRSATTLILKYREIWCNNFIIPQSYCIRIRNLCPYICGWTLFPFDPNRQEDLFLAPEKPPFTRSSSRTQVYAWLASLHVRSCTWLHATVRKEKNMYREKTNIFSTRPSFFSYH